MKIFKTTAALFAATIAALGISVAAGCSSGENEESNVPEIEIPAAPEFTPEETPKQTPSVPEEPRIKEVTYIAVTSDGVNIRSGAGTGYSVRGQAEKSTLYAAETLSNGWYKTSWRNSAGYISQKYCTEIHMRASADERVEAVVEEGLKLLGTPYVYGATRYHDGKGKLLSGFSVNKFDCSSLMQYIFYRGAGVNLDVNTRTQIYQGRTIKKDALERGDLMFFTNESRKNNTGIERVGHVALYLGDNYILHTASDYAKIEKISATRWSYFIQGQRIL